MHFKVFKSSFIYIIDIDETENLSFDIIFSITRKGYRSSKKALFIVLYTMAGMLLKFSSFFCYNKLLVVFFLLQEAYCSRFFTTRSLL